MLPKNHRMELLSKAYVRAVAAHAGCICDEPDDDFGVDLCVRDVTFRQGRYFDAGTLLDLQLKSTTIDGVRAFDDRLHFDLPVRNYDHLREVGGGNPDRLLILFVMPHDEAAWFEQGENEMSLRHCCYFLSLRDFPASENRRTVTVAIPKANVFSPEYLAAVRLERNKR